LVVPRNTVLGALMGPLQRGRKIEGTYSTEGYEHGLLIPRDVIFPREKVPPERDNTGVKHKIPYNMKG